MDYTPPTIKVACLNMNNYDELYLERFEQMLREATRTTQPVEALLLQEVTYSRRREIRDLLDKYGYPHRHFSEPAQKANNPLKGTSTMVATREHLPTMVSLSLQLTGTDNAQRATLVKVSKNGHDIILASAHLLWGAENSHLRGTQAKILNEAVQRQKMLSRKPIAILGGTLNDLPQSTAVRYLKGLSTIDNTGAFWVDATENTEHYRNTTTTPQGYWGMETAKNWGVEYPELVPPRRTDYLLVEGWVWGKAGNPVNVAPFGLSELPDSGGIPISDRTGWVAEFML